MNKLFAKIILISMLLVFIVLVISAFFTKTKIGYFIFVMSFLLVVTLPFIFYIINMFRKLNKENDKDEK